MSPPMLPLDDDPTPDDLVVPLLHAAVQAGHTADRLRALAERHPGADPPAQRQVRQAIAIMIEVQQALIRAADNLHHHGRTDR